MTLKRLSPEDFKAQIQEYKEKEFSFLNEKANLSTFMLESGWKEKTIQRKDFEAWTRKGEEVAVSYNKRSDQWQWRRLEDSEDKAYTPYKMALFMAREANQGKAKDPFYEEGVARDMLRENLANRRIDMRKAFPKYIDVIDFLEKRGGNYPVVEGGLIRKKVENKIVLEPKSIAVDSLEVYKNEQRTDHNPQTSQSINEPRRQSENGMSAQAELKEFLLNEVSLFKYITHLGYKATEYTPKSHIPADIVYEVKKKASYSLNKAGLSVMESIAKDHLPDLVKVSETLFQATNPMGKVGYKSLLIDIENNRFEDKATQLEGGPLELLIAVKGMKFDQAVRTLAETVRVDIPDVKQPSKGVYYVREDHAVKIHRNEETGRYYYYDLEANSKGTALDIIKQIMSAQKGIDIISDRDAFQPLIKFGLNTLDGDKLIALQILSKNVFPEGKFSPTVVQQRLDLEQPRQVGASISR